MDNGQPVVAAGDGIAIRSKEVACGEGKRQIQYLVCKPLEDAGFVNAFSTRTGGVSRLPEQALNLGHFKGDDETNVAENRRRFLAAIGGEGASLVTARQTHSADRFVLESPEQASVRPQVDALLTKHAGLLLGIQTADCLPVLIGDPKTGVIAAVHAGWKGTAGRIAERTVADLMQRLGVDPRTCVAALGPNACVDCYEVGADVITRYKREFGYWRKLLVNFNEDGSKAHLDVRAANVQQLLFCGFTPDRIHNSNYCTMHQNELFFSHRREHRDRPAGVGRLLSVIGRIITKP